MILVFLCGVVRAADRASPPSVAEPTAPPAPIVETAVLSGAVPVWVVERHDVPLVHVALGFDVRALRAEVGPGPFDALDALWKQGVVGRSGVAWGMATTGAGVQLGLDCTAERCTLDLDASTDALADALTLAGELVRAPALAPADLADWRHRAEADWRTDWAGPTIAQDRAIERMLWPAGHPARGDRTAADFRVAPRAVRELWAAIVASAPPAVVVVGDTRLAALRPALDAAFGELRGRTAAPDPRLAARSAPPAFAAERHVGVDAAGTSQVHIAVLWAAPDAGSPDEPAFALVFRALAGSFASPLNLRLREQEGLVYHVDAALLQIAGHGLARVDIAVRPEDTGRAVAIVAEELDRVAATGLSDTALAAARNGAWMAAMTETATNAGLASELLGEALSGQGPGATMTHRHMYQDVSVAEAASVAARWIGAPRLWVLTGPRDTYEEALQGGAFVIDTWLDTCEAVYGGGCPR